VKIKRGQQILSWSQGLRGARAKSFRAEGAKVQFIEEDGSQSGHAASTVER